MNSALLFGARKARQIHTVESLRRERNPDHKERSFAKESFPLNQTEERVSKAFKQLVTTYGSYEFVLDGPLCKTSYHFYVGTQGMILDVGIMAKGLSGQEQDTSTTSYAEFCEPGPKEYSYLVPWCYAVHWQVAEEIAARLLVHLENPDLDYQAAQQKFNQMQKLRRGDLFDQLTKTIAFL